MPRTKALDQLMLLFLDNLQDLAMCFRRTSSRNWLNSLNRSVLASLNFVVDLQVFHDLEVLGRRHVHMRGL